MEHYALTQFQEGLSYLLNAGPYMHDVMIPMLLTVAPELDYETMKRAFDLEIERNDALRLRFQKDGDKLTQYFIPPYEEKNFKLMDFRGKTQEQQERYFSADAGRMLDYLGGEIYRIVFFRAFDGRSGVYINIFHFNMDAAAVGIMFGDLMAVYGSLCGKNELPPPLTPYEEQIKKQLAYPQSERYKKDAAFFTERVKTFGEPLYAGVQGAEFLKKRPKISKSPSGRGLHVGALSRQSCGMLVRHMDGERCRAIERLSFENGVTPQVLVQTAIRVYLMAINDTNDVTLTSTCSNRGTKSEKRTGGCLANILTYRTVLESDMTFAQALQSAGAELNELYRHSMFPFLHQAALTMRLLGHKRPFSYRSLLFSWVPALIDPPRELDAEVKWVCTGKLSGTVYILCAPCFSDGGRDIYCEYRKHLVTEEQAEALLDAMERIVDKALDDINIPISELAEK